MATSSPKRRRGAEAEVGDEGAAAGMVAEDVEASKTDQIKPIEVENELAAGYLHRKSSETPSGILDGTQVMTRTSTQTSPKKRKRTKETSVVTGSRPYRVTLIQASECASGDEDGEAQWLQCYRAL
mmetsp:Transcript_36967/g.78388  ORF Transcript_36967/g.78388 Transcript_36967/m.78388 type:complete len:126 (+) Transcript_36967:976-1353(+)